MYRVEFEMPLGNPRGCLQETSCGMRLDFWRDVEPRNLYLEIISIQELCTVGMNKIILESIMRAEKMPSWS